MKTTRTARSLAALLTATALSLALAGVAAAGDTDGGNTFDSNTTSVVRQALNAFPAPQVSAASSNAIADFVADDHGATAANN